MRLTAAPASTGTACGTMCWSTPRQRSGGGAGAADRGASPADCPAEAIWEELSVPMDWRPDPDACRCFTKEHPTDPPQHALPAAVCRRYPAVCGGVLLMSAIRRGGHPMKTNERPRSWPWSWRRWWSWAYIEPAPAPGGALRGGPRGGAGGGPEGDGGIPCRDRIQDLQPLGDDGEMAEFILSAWGTPTAAATGPARMCPFPSRAWMCP